MDVQPLTLEELVEDATDINNFASNEAQSQAVSNQVNRTIGGASTVVKLLIQKLGMRQEVVTLQVLNVVEVCVKNCGSRFHNEIGKYKFINELIKLLSSKYDGDITPLSVKERVISLMFSWYVGLPHEMKIAEAYKMLKQQGIIKRDPVDPNRTGSEPSPREKENTAFQDEGNTQLLKTLLSSKDAEDLHSANKLIKNMVKEEEERLDRVSKRIQVLETVANNVKLLDDMIGKYEPKSNGSSLEIMNELYERCLTLRPELFRLASKNVDDQDDSVGEILSASDELTRVIDSYKEHVLFKRSSETNEVSTSHLQTADSVSNSAYLLDLDIISPTEQNGEKVQNSLLYEQFKLLGLSTPVNQTATQPIPDVSGFPAMQANWNVNPGMFQAPQVNPNPVQPMFGSLPSSSNMLPNNAVPILRPPNRMPVYNSGSIPPQQSNVTPFVGVPPTVPTVLTSAPKKDLFDFDIFESDFLKVNSSDKSRNNNIQNANNISNSSSNNTNDNITVDHLLSSTQQKTIINDPPVIASRNTVITSTLPVSASVQVVPTVQTKQEPLPPSIPPPMVVPSAVTFPVPVVAPPSTPAPVQLAAPVPVAAIAPSVLPASVPAPNVLPATVPAPVALPASVPAPVALPAPAVLASPAFPAIVPAQVQNIITQPAPTSPVNYLVPLEALKHGKYAPIPILDKDGLKTFLIIAEDTREDANPNVIVSILSTISLNTNPLTAFSIQVAVPKVMRVKLQPATTNELTSFNPLLPPPTISQIMLIANPTKETVKLRFKIVYSLAGTSHVETANIDQLPVR